ncbi:hypothetical protein D3C80_1537420 [compost metagenome]
MCGVAIDDIAEVIGFPALDDGEVTGDRLLHDVRAAVEFADLLAFGHRGAVAGSGEERRDTGTPGADFFCQRALRRQLHFQLTADRLLLEQRVLTNVGGHHLADLPVFQQQTEAKAVDAAVV